MNFRWNPPHWITAECRKLIRGCMHERDHSFCDFVEAGLRDDSPEMRIAIEAYKQGFLMSANMKPPPPLIIVSKDLNVKPEDLTPGPIVSHPTGPSDEDKEKLRDEIARILEQIAEEGKEGLELDAALDAILCGVEDTYCPSHITALD